MAAAAKEESKCSATSFFDKAVAYRSGIVFTRGEKTHQPCYGHFWDGVDEDKSKNIGLKDHEYGHSKEIKGYRWGNITLPGYVGDARGFLLGTQMAMGSATGLLSPTVEKAMYDGIQGDCPDGWQDIPSLPNLSSPSGASMRTGILSVWNSTLLRAVQESVIDEEEEEDLSVKRSDILDWNVENRRETAELQSRLTSRDDSQDDCEEDDSNDEDKPLFKKGPEERALYRAPWIQSKPVYFHGRCDNCDTETGFNENGHGSFQSCSLIYEGKEYKGKRGEDEGRYTCTVEYAC